MCNNPDVIKKAKQHLKRYKIWCVILAVCTGLAFYLATLSRNGGVILSALFVFLFCAMFGSTIAFRKCILSILNKDLDADTYLATIYQGRFDVPTATCQLYGEYFCGNYQNTVNICKTKMATAKKTSKHTYGYLSYLANVYFDIGDEEKLRKICEQYEAYLSKEKSRKQAKYRALFARMTFYDLYVKQDMDACLAWLNAPTPITLHQYHRTFCKARLALMQGNEEEARLYYETLAKEVPQLNYGKLAAIKLAEIENQAPEDFSKTFELSDESTEVTLYPAKLYKSRKILGFSLIAVILIVLVAGGVSTYLNQNKKYEREMAAYLEKIRVLVEEDYDGVEMLNSFTLKNGEEIVDTMFVCKTDTDILVGCLYVYSGQTELHYKKITSVSIASLSEDRSPLWYCSFPSITSHNQIESYFYVIEADVPPEYCHLSTFEINGQKVYYVVTEIVPGLVITIPNE